MEGVGRRDNWGNVNNVQYKPNWNCHYEVLPSCIMNISQYKNFLNNLKIKE
jgi:hypothetical protein